MHSRRRRPSPAALLPLIGSALTYAAYNFVCVRLSRHVSRLHSLRSRHRRSAAQANGRLGDKLDPVLRHRARQLAGRSRVIVQFKGDADVRVFGRGVAGRRLERARAGRRGRQHRARHAWPSDPRVERVMVDRPAFATMERTGAAIGATLAREQFGVTGSGVGVAIIDSGITTLRTTTSIARRAARSSTPRRALQGLHPRRQLEPLVQRPRVGRLRPRHARRRHHRRQRASTPTAAARASRPART